MAVRFSANVGVTLLFPQGTTPGGQQESQYNGKIDDWYTVQVEGQAGEERLYASAFLSSIIQAAPSNRLHITKVDENGRTRWAVLALVNNEWVPVEAPAQAVATPPATPNGFPPPPPQGAPVPAPAPPMAPTGMAPQPPAMAPAPVPAAPVAVLETVAPVAPRTDDVGLMTECYQWALAVQGLLGGRESPVDVSAAAHTFYIQRARRGDVGPSSSYKPPTLPPAAPRHETKPLPVDRATWPDPPPNEAPPPDDAQAPAAALTAGLIAFRREAEQYKNKIATKTGDPTLYYTLLKQHGLAHSSDLTDESKAKPILRSLFEAIETLG